MIHKVLHTWIELQEFISLMTHVFAHGAHPPPLFSTLLVWWRGEDIHKWSTRPTTNTLMAHLCSRAYKNNVHQAGGGTFAIWGLVSWKISKFGGLWAKIWVKIDAVRLKFPNFLKRGSCERTLLLEMGPLRAAEEAWKGGLQGHTSPYPLSRSVPPRVFVVGPISNSQQHIPNKTQSWVPPPFQCLLKKCLTKQNKKQEIKQKQNKTKQKKHDMSRGVLCPCLHKFVDSFH